MRESMEEVLEDEQEHGVEQGVTEEAKTTSGDEKENTIRDGGSNALYTACIVYTVYTVKNALHC